MLFLCFKLKRQPIFAVPKEAVLERFHCKLLTITYIMKLTADFCISYFLSSSKIRSNVLKLNIFFEELNFESITEERSYEVSI